MNLCGALLLNRSLVRTLLNTFDALLVLVLYMHIVLCVAMYKITKFSGTILILK